jgi:hypothetical protein
MRPAGVRPTPPASWPTANILQEVTVDKHTISPAGDPFHVAAPDLDEVGQDAHPHACYDGVVYVGHLVGDANGGEVEVIEAVPCRRCAEEAT